MTPQVQALKRACEAVAAVTSAFGGFLLKIQPPEGTAPHFAVGFAAALSTCVFLVMSILADLLVVRKKYQVIFLALTIPLLSCTIVSGLRYEEFFARNTIPFPPNSEDRVVISNQMTPRGSEIYKSGGQSYSEILFLGGMTSREAIWTRGSIIDTVIQLNNLYIFFSVFLSASVFCLLEGVVPTKSPIPGDA